MSLDFFRKFIPGYANVAKPLTDLLRDDEEFRWDDEQQKSFDELKRLITSSSIMVTPDYTRDKIVIPDASNYAIGGVLLQKCDDGKYRPCAYMSYKLPHNCKWSPYEVELWAMIRALQVWKHHLIGSRFKIKTDHSPLKYFSSQKRVSDKLSRWLDFLSEFDFEIEHIPGIDNTAADGLSRRPDHILEDGDLVGCLYISRDESRAGTKGWTTHSPNYHHSSDADSADMIYLYEYFGALIEGLPEKDALYEAIKRAYRHDDLIR